MKWWQKLDRDRKPIKGCWLRPDGYTVVLCRLPAKSYTIIRPGGSAPFAYTGCLKDVPLLIEADIEASAALARAGRPA